MKAPKIALGLVVVVLASGTGFFGYQYFTSTARAASGPAKGEHAAEPEAASSHGSSGAEPEAAAEGEHAEAAEDGKPAKGSSNVLYPMRSFVVNLADRSKGRYLKVSLGLVVRKSVEARLTTDNLALASVQDRTLTLLSTKTVEDLLSADGKFLLKQELTMQLNSVLGEGSVQDVYFADFIIQ